MTDRRLLIRPDDAPDKTGLIAILPPAAAGWEHLGMAFVRLNAGGKFPISTHENEHVSIILGGRANYRTNQGDFLNVGGRRNVFDGLPHALYLPRHTEIEIEALTDGFEVVACWTATDQDHPARHITPADVTSEIRGGGNMTRQIVNIVPPGFPAHKLVIVEVFTPAGNWSSYPPHKHDEHRVGDDGALLEADLEEIYFYKHARPEGYAYQRIYTTDTSLDALLMARSNDIVLVPEGYHPVVSAGGYDTYYLNILAGSAHSLANSDDPAHTWIKATWDAPDPRLPLVTLEMEAAR
ncbi:MAG: 5-deoxy-glucuronate isomerase [Chloroflexota bacterium]|nr:5-deoxy-glucuronate isomerase [Chloroflexota bacterium]